VFEECVQGVRRSWVGASLPWESAGGCRQEADFTVICLPGEAWVRLSALLVKAGPSWKPTVGPTRMGYVRFEWG
jgi:hypothetical protein